MRIRHCDLFRCYISNGGRNFDYSYQVSKKLGTPLNAGTAKFKGGGGNPLENNKQNKLSYASIYLVGRY